jgi:hypothetical protein
LDLGEDAGRYGKSTHLRGGRQCKSCRAFSNQHGKALSRLEEGLSNTQEFMPGVFINVSRSERVQRAAYGDHWEVRNTKTAFYDSMVKEVLSQQFTLLLNVIMLDMTQVVTDGAFPTENEP